jgi:hypothetical protein
MSKACCICGSAFSAIRQQIRFKPCKHDDFCAPCILDWFCEKSPRFKEYREFHENEAQVRVLTLDGLVRLGLCWAAAEDIAKGDGMIGCAYCRRLLEGVEVVVVG